MKRAYHKSWQNRRPGWTKRVKWYEGRLERGDTIPLLSIRLNFVDLDEHRECNVFYTDYAEATRDYEDFIAGAVTVKQLMEKRDRPPDES